MARRAAALERQRPRRRGLARGQAGERRGSPPGDVDVLNNSYTCILLF